jgi:hypothetical protein
MNGHPEMPDPGVEMRPRELVKAIEKWAASQGYTTEATRAAGEAGKVVVRDPANGSTYTTIPNPRSGRRLGKDQVRYTVQHLNRNWRG